MGEGETILSVFVTEFRMLRNAIFYNVASPTKMKKSIIHRKLHQAWPHPLSSCDVKQNNNKSKSDQCRVISSLDRIKNSLSLLPHWSTHKPLSSITLVTITFRCMLSYLVENNPPPCSHKLPQRTSDLEEELLEISYPKTLRIEAFGWRRQ